MDALRAFVNSHADLADCPLIAIAVDGLLRSVEVRLELIYDDNGRYLPEHLVGPVLSVRFDNCLEVQINSGLPSRFLRNPEDLSRDVAQIAGMRFESAPSKFVGSPALLAKVVIGFDQSGIGGRREVSIVAERASFTISTAD